MLYLKIYDSSDSKLSSPSESYKASHQRLEYYRNKQTPKSAHVEKGKIFHQMGESTNTKFNEGNVELFEKVIISMTESQGCENDLSTTEKQKK